MLRNLLLFVVLLPLSSCGVETETTSGTEIGFESNGVMQYLGIRYAEPPTGERRFAAPVPRAAPTEKHYATGFGGSCQEVEDCLFLNVWHPKEAKALPVMVFIHGGGFVMGSGGDASDLAKKGNVVTVTLNYRLGVFGFLSHAALAGETGNYGLLDQQLALQWVRDNIAAFGGDPANVTVFGESAGAASVCSHLLSPRANGLFHRAIAESGSCVLPPLTKERAMKTGATLVEKLGCGADVPKCLRAATADALKKAIPAGIEFDLDVDRWGPVADGEVLPLDPFGAFERGDFNRVPFLSGANGNEGSLFTLGMTMDTRADFEKLVAGAVRTHGAEALQLYSETAYPKPRDAATALIGDAFVCGQRKQAAMIAQHVPSSYLYHFTRVNPSLKGNLGATHGEEVPYVFGNIGFPLTNTAEDTALSNEVIGYWTRFAKAGDPNGGDAVGWPQLTVSGGEYQVLDTTLESRQHLQAERCDVLEAWLPNL